MNESKGAILPTGGDIIVARDGLDLRDMDDLIVYLAETAIGQAVTLDTIREAERQSVDMILQERPAN